MSFQSFPGAFWKPFDKALRKTKNPIFISIFASSLSSLRRTSSSTESNIASKACGKVKTGAVDTIQRGARLSKSESIAPMVNLPGSRRSNVRLAGSQSADKNDVFGSFHEFATVQLTHERFVDLTGSKVQLQSAVRTPPA
jgi:hypothetical protein